MKHESKFLISLLLILLLKLIITIHTSKTVSKTIKLHHSNKQFQLINLFKNEFKNVKNTFQNKVKKLSTKIKSKQLNKFIKSKLFKSPIGFVKNFYKQKIIRNQEYYSSFQGVCYLIKDSLFIKNTTCLEIIRANGVFQRKRSCKNKQEKKEATIILTITSEEDNLEVFPIATIQAMFQKWQCVNPKGALDE